ncbi:MAG: hypothetical protein JJ902_20980 [Roseibium sp.]|nr:hypothetical protein [Roseibium sp.]
MFGKAEHPFFDPLWRRVLLVAFCVFWAGVEFYSSNALWGYVFLAIAAYAAWAYLIAYQKTDGSGNPPAGDG